MTCHILPGHQPQDLGTASLNHFALFNPMHKCVRAEAEASLCCESSCCAVLRRRGPRPCTGALRAALQSHTLLRGLSSAALLPGGCSGGQGTTTQGMATYAWHMFMLASCTASTLLPTCSPPLCAQRGLLRPRRSRVTTANFESADQSGVIQASPGTGLQLGWSGCAKKR